MNLCFKCCIYFGNPSLIFLSSSYCNMVLCVMLWVLSCMQLRLCFWIGKVLHKFPLLLCGVCVCECVYAHKYRCLTERWSLILFWACNRSKHMFCLLPDVPCFVCWQMFCLSTVFFQILFRYELLYVLNSESDILLVINLFCFT